MKFLCYNFFDMKICQKFFLFFVFSIPFFSCKSMIFNKVGDMLSGADKNGVPIKAKDDAANPMSAFMGETDIRIIQETLPIILKMYEILALENPYHQGTQIMAGQLNVMYGNLCVQTPAEKMPIDMLFEQVDEFNRAKYHYIKGRKYILDAFESRWPGFTEAFLSADPEKARPVAQKISKSDINAAYWAAGSSLIAWSLDPLDITMLTSIAGPVALLERAAELDPDYSNGAIWDALCQFYAAAPMEFGGDQERARYCYEQAMRVSGGKSPGIYVTYAQSFCKPSGDREGFVKALESALAIDVNEDESNRVMNVLGQQKARYLLDHVDDYFLEW